MRVNKLKTSIKACITWMVHSVISFLTVSKVGRYFYAQIIRDIVGRQCEIRYHEVSLKFAVPNALNQYRVDTFATKEPETLEWIDRMSAGSIVWDIGANVGLYSCYCAIKRDCRVFSFEPSVFNLELLARNIFSNGLTDKVTIVPLPLTESLTLSKLNMTSVDWGGALSTFGQGYGHDGKDINKVFEFPTVGISMAEVVNLLKIPAPDYIKMDVDGIEHLILKGGGEVLKQVREVLIEINDKFEDQADNARQCLLDAGFVLKEKRHADYFDLHGGTGKHTFNQIWVRGAD